MNSMMLESVYLAFSSGSSVAFLVRSMALPMKPEDDVDVDVIDQTLRMLNLEAVRCIDCTDENEFELAPSWAPWLLAGGYATYTFM